MYRIGIDLGGTKIDGVLIAAAGHDVGRKRIATGRGRGYRHILNRIKSLYDDLVTA